MIAAKASASLWSNFLERGCPTIAIALTRFMKRRYVACGADPNRILVKPNSVECRMDDSPSERDGVIFAGRLSPEKGVLELVRSWPPEAPRLTVVGNGPLADAARRVSGANVVMEGFLGQGEVRGLLRSARVLVLPSLWFEGLPLIALEAFAEGTPVVAFRGGGLEEVLKRIDPRCSLPSSDFGSLCDAARRVAEAEDWRSLSERCATEYRQFFSPEANLTALRNAYSRARRLEACSIEA
jgi:glycosyltransferase involved in cell wall biosynthesis